MDIKVVRVAHEYDAVQPTAVSAHLRGGSPTLGEVRMRIYE